jgi:hypothetical protein
MGKYWDKRTRRLMTTTRRGMIQRCWYEALVGGVVLGVLTYCLIKVT